LKTNRDSLSLSSEAARLQGRTSPIAEIAYQRAGTAREILRHFRKRRMNPEIFFLVMVAKAGIQKSQESEKAFSNPSF
jgi:hypothetical protein